MDEKIKIIGVILSVVMIFFVMNIFNNKNNISEDYEILNIDASYNNETGEYYLIDETTGEITHTAETEEELYIYKIDSDYDPKSGEEATEKDFEILY